MTVSSDGQMFTYTTNTGGPTMPSWDGYGDGNVAWSAWEAGGILWPARDRRQS